MIRGDAERRLRSNLHGMRVQLPPAARSGLLLEARHGEALAGALVSAPPFHWPFEPPRLGARLRYLMGQGLRVARRWGQVAEVLHAEHELGPHWYLATLGVDPECQGQGVGSALLRHWLGLVDEDGRPAYLETDDPRNLPFYGRAGFATTREVRIFGVKVWLMARPGAQPEAARPA